MLGFKYCIYRQRENKEQPASIDSQHLFRVLSFETDLDGFSWVNLTTKNQSLLFLGGHGYPYRYTGQLRDLFSDIENVLSNCKTIRVATGKSSNIPEWMVSEQDVVTSLSYKEALSQCDPNEWLLIEVWDQG